MILIIDNVRCRQYIYSLHGKNEDLASGGYVDIANSELAVKKI